MPAPYDRKPSSIVNDPYSTDSPVVQKQKLIEAKWWERELLLMRQLAKADLFSAYIRATLTHRRRSPAGRVLPEPTQLTESGSDWWVMFRQCESKIVDELRRKGMV